MIDVRRLRALQAVVETGSVSAAAGLLSYSPSAVSQQMSALEREVGVRLFERAGRGVRPTDAALLLCEHATRVLASINDAEDAIAALASGHSGRIRLGAFPTAGSSLVPGALAAFQALHPKVALDLVVVEGYEGITNLRSGSIDVLVAVEPMSPGGASDDDLVHRHLLADPFRVVLPRSHPLSARQTVDLALLASERFIGVSSFPASCQLVIESACAQAGFRPVYAIEADEYPTAQGFVAAGLGVAFVPMLALGSSLHPGVAVRRLKGAQPARQVWALTRRAIIDQVPILAMLSCLQTAANEFVRDVVEAPPPSLEALFSGAGYY
ncbi:MAG: LysR family transcriptional regulator [Acidimicrobiales bacterium]